MKLSGVKIFFATLAALLVAMAIGYSIWRHEQWTQARDHFAGVINSSYSGTRDLQGDPESQLASLNAAQSRAASAAEESATTEFLIGDKFLGEFSFFPFRCRERECLRIEDSYGKSSLQKYWTLLPPRSATRR